ncbi:Receptor-like protein kinase FERONIA [Vitis vinifera]|uniref:Receptor-like protein kinase FERONIA n=1 Tax=Vitis vinifera TaxID=29760 RepID=A0A438BVT6_VITVI|nr:Receptor-like protein kinase FERONIA [Vitis vinifera]
MSFQNLAGRGGSEGGKISELHRGRVLSETCLLCYSFTLLDFIREYYAALALGSPSPLPATDHAVFPRLHYYITIGVTISTLQRRHIPHTAAHSLHGYHAAGMTPEMPTFTRTTNNATVYTASSTPFDDGSSYTSVAQGSFRDRFYKTNKVLLTWKQWLEIGIGAARGLKHLHQGSECEIIHQDIKTTDISLDEKRVAKFADFGVVLFEVLCAGLAVKGP